MQTRHLGIAHNAQSSAGPTAAGRPPRDGTDDCGVSMKQTLDAIRGSHYLPLTSARRAVDQSAPRSLLTKRVKRARPKRSSMMRTCDSDEETKSLPAQSDPETTDGLGFACPFYRKDPTQFVDCINYRLTRIRDVKQHISRKHVINPLYCPTCFISFSTSPQRDEHIRSRHCRPRKRLAVHGPLEISPTALDALKNRVSSKEPEDQWFEVWRIIFPNDAKPDNPYIGTMLEEAVGMLGEFWASESSRIVPAYLETQGVPMEWERPIQGLFTGLLDYIQEHLKSADAMTPDDNDTASFTSKRSMSTRTEQSSYSDIVPTPSSSSMYGSPPTPRQLVDTPNFFPSAEWGAKINTSPPMDESLVLSTGSLDIPMGLVFAEDTGTKQIYAEPNSYGPELWPDDVGPATEMFAASYHTGLDWDVADSFNVHESPDQKGLTGGGFQFGSV